jgi:predicted RNA-binding protein with PIN domain
VPVLVDGDNLLGSWPGRSRSEVERRALSRQLAAFAREMGKSVLLFYDGSPQTPQGLGAEVHFSGPGRTADDLILAHIKGRKDRRGFLVVTNDRSLADRCRWLGAKVERCDVFRKRILATERKETPVQPNDVDYWLGVFGEEE